MEHVLSLWCGCMGFDVTGAVRSRVSRIKVTQNPSNHTEGWYDPLLPVCRSSTLLLYVMLCCFAVCTSSNVKFERTWFFTLGITSVWPHHQFLSPCWNLCVWPAFVLRCAALSVSRRCLVSTLICPCLLLPVFRTQSAVKNRAAKVTAGRSWAGFCFFFLFFFYFLPCGHLSLWPVMHALPWISGMLRWFLCKSYERL